MTVRGGRTRAPGDAATGGSSADAASETFHALLLRDLPGVGAVRFRRLVDRFGSPSGALAAPARAFEQIAGREASDARRADAPAARASALAERCAELGARVLAYGGPEYPARLGDLPDPPPVLFVLGRAGLLNRDCAAVVGSRRATAYGRRVARRLGAALVERGGCVISGMALGIDAEAHWGALPGPTVAVLGSGVDVAAPARNASLYDKIAASGAVASEYAPGTDAAPGHFPARNRIIAALAAEVVVVEASARSGALITAEIALDLGREVHAVPGPIDRPTSQGTNRLLADGAGVVLDASLGAGAAPDEAMPSDPELRELLSALPAGPVSLDEFAALAGQPVETLAASVTVLQLQGFVAATRDGRFMRTPGGRPGVVRERRPRRCPASATVASPGSGRNGVVRERRPPGLFGVEAPGCRRTGAMRQRWPRRVWT